MFEVTIKTDNAAFGEGFDEAQVEIGRVLGQVRDQVELGWRSGRVTDSNGNVVGRFEYDEEGE